MKKVSKMQKTVWLLSLLPLVLTAVFYSRLPEQIPMHWGFGGEVGYDDKWQLWIVAGMGPVLAALFYFLPRFDPKNSNYRKFTASYVGLQTVVMLFLTAMLGICIAEGLRPGTVDVPTVVCLLVSLVMVYLGNIMPKFRMNWYCGIKNPWTLSSETVWTRTHRIAGRMFFAAGLIGVAGAFVPGNVAKFAFLFAPLALALLVPMVLSWKMYREETGK